MDVQELEDAITVIKIIYPILSGCFFVIIGLLIFIWKNDKASLKEENENRDSTMRKVVENLQTLTVLVNRHDVDIDNMKQ